jgi:hypothetical protein
LTATNTPIPTATETPEATATHTAIPAGTSTIPAQGTPAVTRTALATRTVISTRTVVATHTAAATRTIVATRTVLPASPTQHASEDCLTPGQKLWLLVGIFRRYGAQEGTWRYKGRFDVNYDGRIDWKDAKAVIDAPLCRHLWRR